MNIEEPGTLLRYGYIALAAVSGAFTALSFVRWKDMGAMELTLTLLGGFSFAIFVTPWIAHEVMGVEDSNVRAIAALTYVFGSGSNILLPLVIGWVKRILGSGEAA
ncbi:hypothetical protein COA17_07225 [Sphingomonas ginsenosidimutans]|uniref:Major facilitator superfamily (MFS) profile domain-containing protein n=1 Tax=Sphingomonas ginsenosidimutans TaxID=862134 RepID=A0A2A4I074_9SPHN|nr:hypothetical protein [Sphingomonas ginsenosidimutans]PCG09643.1 hypothetical protein COA17_07225 [Sphingomonas ginsenosidimutans]